MRQDLIASARQIADNIKASEHGYDAALATNARLLAAMLDARRESGAPGGVGREALKNAASAIALGVQAREMLLDAHQELARINLRELAAGDLSECPEKWAFTGKLSLVEGEGRAA